MALLMSNDRDLRHHINAPPWEAVDGYASRVRKRMAPVPGTSAFNGRDLGTRVDLLCV
jgi:hypothetical protein